MLLGVFQRLHQSFFEPLTLLFMNTRWYVTYTFPNAEKKAHKLLSESGIDVFLPLVKTVRNWSDRKKLIHVPLFPNYIFVNIEEKFRAQVLKFPGIIRFLTCNGKPSVIPEFEISAIKQIVESGYNVSIETDVCEGDVVRIVNGPFDGLECILVKKSTENKFVLKLVSLNKFIVLKTDNAHLEKIKPRATAQVAAL
jgi:transcription antitermination factor NusG